MIPATSVILALAAAQDGHTLEELDTLLPGGTEDLVVALGQICTAGGASCKGDRWKLTTSPAEAISRVIRHCETTAASSMAPTGE